MNRLTKDYLIDCGCTVADVGKEKYHEIYTEKLVLAIKKLNDLEDIEEEFGVELIKILTAKEVYVFKIGVVAPYKLGKTNKIVKCSKFNFNFTNKTIEIYVPKSGLYCEKFSDYGKTWAFTKGELQSNER